MDLDRLEARLARAFSAKPQVLGEASIIWRREPIPLWQWVEELMEEADREEVGDDSLKYWPGSVQHLLDGHLHDLLSFYWDGLGPTSSGAGLQILDLGGCGYLVFWNEWEGFQVVDVERRRLRSYAGSQVRIGTKRRSPCGPGSAQLRGAAVAI